eukprot:scaffold7386_cov71-Phaeocystis_antarctica.AAC.3
MWLPDRTGRRRLRCIGQRDGSSRTGRRLVCLQPALIGRDGTNCDLRDARRRGCGQRHARPPMASGSGTAA